MDKERADDPAFITSGGRWRWRWRTGPLKLESRGMPLELEWQDSSYEYTFEATNRDSCKV